MPLPASMDVAVTAFVMTFPDVLTLTTVRSPDNVALIADRFPVTETCCAFRVVPASIEVVVFSDVTFVAPAVKVPVVPIGPCAASDATVVA